MRNVAKRTVSGIATQIDKLYGEGTVYSLIPSEQYDGTSGKTYILLNSIESTSPSWHNTLVDYCRARNVFMEPINSSMLGIYFI